MPNIAFEDVNLGEIDAGETYAVQWIEMTINIDDAPAVTLTARFTYDRKNGAWSVIRDDPNPVEYRDARDDEWNDLKRGDPSLMKALASLPFFDAVERQGEAIEAARRKNLQCELDKLEARAAKLRQLLDT